MNEDARSIKAWVGVSGWCWHGPNAAPEFSSEIAGPADAFHHNIERLLRLGRALDDAYSVGKRTGSIEACAMLHITGKTFIALNPTHDDFKTMADASLQAMKWARGVEEMPPWVILSQSSGYHAGEFILTSQGSDFSMAVDALIVSLLTGAWTAFEVLAGDLWESAINAHPTGLARLSGNRKRIGQGETDYVDSGDDENSDETDGDLNDGKVVLLKDLERAGKGKYDLSGCMGTVLRRRFRFNKLNAIREAYSCVFSEKQKRSPALIDAALSDPVLDALSLLRNLVVHKGGKADDEYRRRAGSIACTPQLAPDEVFLPTRDTLDLVIAPAISKSRDLIAAVDNWISQRDD